MIGHHFSVSALWYAASASGVSCSRRRNVVAGVAMRWRTAGSASASTDRRVEPGDDVLGRALGRPEPGPHRDVDARHARLVGGRDVGRGGPALLGQHGIGLDPAAADVRQHLRGLGADPQVDLPADQILVGRAAAAIRHELEARAGDVLEMDAADVARAAGADGGGRRLVRVGFQPGDQLLQIVRRQSLPPDDHGRRDQQHRNRLEIVQDVVGDRIHRGPPTWLVQLPMLSV